MVLMDKLPYVFYNINVTEKIARNQIATAEAQIAALREHMVNNAQNLVGTASERYTGPDSGIDPRQWFDCSGFICFLVQEAARECKVDITTPRHANEQWRVLGEQTDYSMRNRGDLVFFPRLRGRTLWTIGHVGVVLSQDSYIHAPGVPNSAVEVRDLPYRQKRIEQISDNDIIMLDPAGIKRLSLPVGDGRWRVW